MFTNCGNVWYKKVLKLHPNLLPFKLDLHLTRIGVQDADIADVLAKVDGLNARLIFGRTLLGFCKVNGSRLYICWLDNLTRFS